MIRNLEKSDIENGLIRLGLKPGTMLEVHCSLGSLGYIEGSAETIINAIKNVVASDGTILMPSFMLSPNLPLDETDREMGLTLKIKILKNDDEKSSMGIVSDTFRSMPDVVTGQGGWWITAGKWFERE